MHIEINSGGLGGFAVAEFQLNMSGFLSDAESVISSFKTVTTKACGLEGGLGNLADAVGEISARIQEEEQKREAAAAVQQKTDDFLALAERVDKQVAALVNKNKDEFYRVNSWARPGTSAEETAWYDKAWDWLCGAGEAIAEGVKDAWEWTKDTAKKAWDGLVDFYNEHKKIIDTVLIIVGAIAAIAAVVVTGGAALVPLLAALGCSASVAAAISGAVAVIAVVSMAASSALNVIDIWAEIDNPTFNAWQKGLNIVSGVSNLLYSVGSIYNSIKHISPEQAKNMAKNAFADTRGTTVNGQKVSFLSDYQPGADEFINRELLTDQSRNHFYAVDNPYGGKIYVSADPCTGSGVYDLVANSTDDVIVLSGTHGSASGKLSFDDSYKFFVEDSNNFMFHDNVSVFNLQDMVTIDEYGMVNGIHHEFVTGLFTSGKDIVCAWCYSDRSLFIKGLFGLT